MHNSIDKYPTRQSSKEKIIDRVDPVIFGEKKSGQYALSKQQLRQFEDEGFVLIEDLFSKEEVNKLREECDSLVQNRDYHGDEAFVTEENSDIVRSIFDLPKYSKTFDALSKDPRLTTIAKQLIGEDIYLHQSRINIKPALDGKSFPWHSDFETWHSEDGLPAPKVVTGWIMLTENTAYNGPLFVIPKSHKKYVSCPGETPKDNHKQSLKNQMLGTPSLEAINEFTKDSGGQIVGVYGKPGTVVFHECNIMHGSPDNISPWPRTNCFFVYNSSDNKPQNPPFGAKKLRPQFLCNTDTTPIA